MDDGMRKVLNAERKTNVLESWTKLSLATRAQKLREYACVYATKHGLAEGEQHQLCQYLVDCVNRNRLKSVKEVNYDRPSGKITDIPSLTYTRSELSTPHFTLRNHVSHVTTLRGLRPMSTSSTSTSILTSAPTSTSTPIESNGSIEMDIVKEESDS